jgi:elongation factor 1 alpha-like protein
MSRHQAFRNVQSTVSEHLYDDDDYYSDEAEQELSAEDKAAMEQGTADVKAALGVEASKVTAEQIQEALWHYYYDIDKTVTYLLTKFIAPPPPKAAKSAQKTQSGKHTISCSAFGTSCPVSRFGSGASTHSIFPCLGTLGYTDSGRPLLVDHVVLPIMRNRGNKEVAAR